jgi:multiple sugar transport system permease protein/putative aldouronate transport system permease protein
MAANQQVDRKKLQDSIWRKARSKWQLYLLLVLPLTYILVFHYIPIYGAQIAFKKFHAGKGIWGSPWVGLDHFVRFIKYPKFAELLANTLILNLYGLLAGFIFPIMFALSLNIIVNRYFKKVVQMFAYLPNFISLVVLAGMLFQFFNPRIGVFGRLISHLAGQPTDIFLKSTSFRHIIVWSGVWQGMGFGSIIYLSSLAGVSPELHEAAMIDGASLARRTWHIDLPAIIPTAMIMLILALGNMLSTGFEKILLFQTPLNLSVSEVIDTYVYKVGLSSLLPDAGYATAIGLFKSVIGFIFLIAANKLSATLSENSLW